MGVKKYKVCSHCGKTLPANREYFKRIKDIETGKEKYSDICRECESIVEYKHEWHEGKLLCHICGEYLDPDLFDEAGEGKYKIRNGKDKRCHKCKIELNRLARSNYSEDLKRVKTLQARWLNARDRAKRKNIPFTITKEFLQELWDKLLGLCAISKIPMTCELDQGRVYTNVSVDLIEQGKGYTEDNVQLVCSAVNQLKSDWDMDTVLYICKLVVNNYN